MKADEQTAPHERICRNLARELEKLVSWKWDGRFSAALAEFAGADSAVIRAIVERYMPNAWDSVTVAQAPDATQEIKRLLGGLMPGQLLMCSDEDQEVIVYSAWWPWGNGQTISIRISAASLESFDDRAKSLFVTSLRSCFGV